MELCNARFPPIADVDDAPVRDHAQIGVQRGLRSMTNRLCFVALLFVCGCASQALDQSIAQPSLAPEPAERVASLRAFEQQIEDAISRRDAIFLDRVTAATFTRTSPEGKVEDRATVMGLLRQPPQYAAVIRRTIDPTTQQVQLHGDIGITRGTLDVRGPRRASKIQYLGAYRWRASQWEILSYNIISVTPLSI